MLYILGRFAYEQPGHGLIFSIDLRKKMVKYYYDNLKNKALILNKVKKF